MRPPTAAAKYRDSLYFSSRNCPEEWRIEKTPCSTRVFPRLLLIVGILLIATTIAQAQCTALLSPSGQCATLTTDYNNTSASGGTNDAIYTYHGTGDLTAYLAAGTAVTYQWYVFNTLSKTYDPIVGTTDTQTGLTDGGYLVRITDNAANICEARAWVWNTEIIANAGSDPAMICGTAPITLNGSRGTPTSETYTYYDPVPFLATSFVGAGTTISIEFNAEHTWVSDLNYYLVGPEECGSPVLFLGGINGYGVCNSGDDVTSLVFSSASPDNYDICNLPVPINGTFGLNNGAPINWSALNGCNFRGEWTVKIFDCEINDTGRLTYISLSLQDALATVNYNSGGLSLILNDNSCATDTPTEYIIPAAPPLTPPSPITYNNSAAAGNGITNNPNGGFQWSSSPAATGPWTPFENTALSTVVNPTADTYYQLEVEDALGCLSSDVVFVDVDPLVPQPAFSCAATDISNCDGLYSLMQVDNNPNTAATSTGVFSGALANYLSGSTVPGSNASFDPAALPIGVPLSLTYTLTASSGCQSSTTCTYTIMPSSLPSAGGY